MNSNSIDLLPCRKILNELSSEEVTHVEGKDSPASTGVLAPTTQIYQTSTGQYSTNFSVLLLLYLHKKSG